jgi:hypothetical protein
MMLGVAHGPAMLPARLWLRIFLLRPTGICYVHVFFATSLFLNFCNALWQIVLIKIYAPVGYIHDYWLHPHIFSIFLIWRLHVAQYACTMLNFNLDPKDRDSNRPIPSTRALPSKKDATRFHVSSPPYTILFSESLNPSSPDQDTTERPSSSRMLAARPISTLWRSRRNLSALCPDRFLILLNLGPWVLKPSIYKDAMSAISSRWCPGFGSYMLLAGSGPSKAV